MSDLAFKQHIANAPLPPLTPNGAEPMASPQASGAAPQAEQSARLNFNASGNSAGPRFGGYWPHPGHGHGPWNPCPPPQNAGPPPRPNPSRPDSWRPDPHYSRRSNEQLAQQFLNNYNAFSGMSPGGRTVTLQDIQKMANLSEFQNPGMRDNIRLAREMLRRPELIQALDRNGATGAVDGRFTREDIASVIKSDNPLKYSDDQQLMRELLQHFNQLVPFSWFSPLRLSDLKNLASRPLTGNPQTDHLTQLAKELTSRSSLMNRLDNLGWRDGFVWKHELHKALR